VLRIALAQINPVVGDLAGNARLIRAAVGEAASQGAQLVLVPEMALTGYPIEDLALRPSFQDAARQALDDLARELGAHELAAFPEVTVIVGCLDVLDADDQPMAGRPRRAPVNAAAVITRGLVTARYIKHHLPNYGVFDEARYFVPGNEPLLINVAGHRVMVAICEDLWQEGGPVTWARELGCDLLAVLNASPYERDKDDVRLALCQTRALEAHCALAYANIVGGQDELVFDGDSLVVSADGTLLARAPQFESAILLAELGGLPSTIAPRRDDVAEVYSALVCGLRDYVDKNGFASVLIGLSGGIDSALVAALAVDAFGPQRVFGIAMPSRYSSAHSVADAFDLAARTGLSIREVSIAPMFNAYMDALDLSGLAEENLQARIRGTTLMGVSNAEGHLVLATGNKSEISVGYSTIYGDAVGGYAPIKDVPKTLVWELARWRNDEATRQGQTPPIPPNSIDKPPSAELRPDQLDADSLPDYEVLDRLLEAYVTGDRSARDLVVAGFDQAMVERILRLTDLAEYKRRQYPPGTKITLRAFGRDRRLPITNRWHESG
jgi:NAD+ synthase (glutamine-hydrolysing)